MTGMAAGPLWPRWKWFFIIAAIIVLFAVFPVILALAAGLIAWSHDCMLTEAGPQTCMVAGMDLGELLSAIFIMHWFGLMTLPLGAIGLAAWVVLFIVLRLVSRWRRARAAN